MPPKTEAQKKAQKKYMEKFSVAQIRIETWKYEQLKAYCEARGESVSGFVNRAIDEAMERDNGK